MGVLAVLAAALGGFVTGAVWYMSLARPWVRAAGLSVDENGKPQGGNTYTPFLIGALCMILVAGMMRHMLVMAGIDGPLPSAVAGFGVGLFFIAPWVVMNYAYAMRTRALALIDGGYSILGPTVIGLILGLF